MEMPEAVIAGKWVASTRTHRGKRKFSGSALREEPRTTRSSDRCYARDVERFDMLLVLDLDETLIFAEEPSKLPHPPEFMIGPYGVLRRPGLARFLAFAFARFREVAVWTASTRSYAEPLLEQVLAPTQQLAFLWGRERCTLRVDWELRESVRIKDIVKLRRRGYDDRRVLFVDDSPEKLVRSYGNLVCVRPFLGDPADRELALLERYLEQLGPLDNVRTIEKRGWQRHVETT
jgi:TFIIF-interacting CTD phosphatase-like protein